MTHCTGCKTRAEHLPHLECYYLTECISRAKKAAIIYRRTKTESDDVMEKGTMLFALALDDEVATIHIFQHLSFTYFMPTMVVISSSSALKCLIL